MSKSRAAAPYRYPRAAAHLIYNPPAVSRLVLVLQLVCLSLWSVADARAQARTERRISPLRAVVNFSDLANAAATRDPAGAPQQNVHPFMHVPSALPVPGVAPSLPRPLPRIEPAPSAP